jgi:hypothetical protein
MFTPICNSWATNWRLKDPHRMLWNGQETSYSKIIFDGLLIFINFAHHKEYLTVSKSADECKKRYISAYRIIVG